MMTKLFARRVYYNISTKLVMNSNEPLDEDKIVPQNRDFLLQG
jgi:hypothetical protein